jgi:hyperosmotically inducible protein
MNSKIAACFLVAGALMLPVAGYTADKDSDRTSPKDFVKDSVITAKIKSLLAQEKLSTLVKIKVDTDAKGVVYLSGTAPTKMAADKAVEIAKAQKGVTEVKSTIEIKADK